MTAVVRQVNANGVEIASRAVAITRKTLADGSVNPNYVKAVLELAEQEKHHAAASQVVAMAAQKGFRRNKYDGTCVATGCTVRANSGFVAKNDAGRWVTYSFAAVQTIVGFVFNG